MKARHYRFVAEELRSIAESMRDPAARSVLEEAANGYDRMARLAEQLRPIAGRFFIAIPAETPPIASRNDPGAESAPSIRQSIRKYW